MAIFIGIFYGNFYGCYGYYTFQALSKKQQSQKNTLLKKGIMNIPLRRCSIQILKKGLRWRLCEGKLMTSRRDPQPFFRDGSSRPPRQPFSHPLRHMMFEQPGVQPILGISRPETLTDADTLAVPMENPDVTYQSVEHFYTLPQDPSIVMGWPPESYGMAFGEITPVRGLPAPAPVPEIQEVEIPLPQAPSAVPAQPSVQPSAQPQAPIESAPAVPAQPSVQPSVQPSAQPQAPIESAPAVPAQPSVQPSVQPSAQPQAPIESAPAVPVMAVPAPEADALSEIQEIPSVPEGAPGAEGSCAAEGAGGVAQGVAQGSALGGGAEGVAQGGPPVFHAFQPFTLTLLRKGVRVQSQVAQMAQVAVAQVAVAQVAVAPVAVAQVAVAQVALLAVMGSLYSGIFCFGYSCSRFFYGRPNTVSTKSEKCVKNI